jgi:cobalt-zinc-cadmium efflux system membrane fusion protein
MFAEARITIHDQEPLVIAPREAVQWEGCCNVVFIRKSESTFQPRKVKLGHETDGWVVVLAGLEADEPVVTRGSFLLKTEIMKGNIGAGCCEAHGAK